MKKSVSILLVLVLSVSVIALTTSAIYSSNYLKSYASTATVSGKNVTISTMVTGVSTMESIGISSIILYEKPKNATKWNYVDTYTSDDFPDIVSYGSAMSVSSPSFDGTSGSSYYAAITVFASKNGGSDSRTITTNTVTVP